MTLRRTVLASAVTAVLGATLVGAASAPVPVAVARPQVPAELCPPGRAPVEGAGLRGGLGCEPVREIEDLSPAARQVAAVDATRAQQSGVDGFRAYQQATALRARAEAARAAAGSDDYVVRGQAVGDSGATWKEVGPRPLVFDDPEYPGGALGIGNASGRLAAVHIDRADPTGDTVIIGAAGGGVWRSTDAGKTWKDLSAGLPTLAIGHIGMVGPRLVVGTGEPNTGTDNYAGFGVFYSDDTGTTWKRSAGSPADTVISRIEVTGTTVYAATSTGVYRSDDSGTTFVKVPLPTGGTTEGTAAFQNWVSDVRVRPGVPTEVTAAVGWRSGAPGAGLYRSTDGGKTFSKLVSPTFGRQTESTGPADEQIGRTNITYQYGKDQSNAVMWAVIEDPRKINNENNPLALNAASATGLPVPAKIPFTTLNGVYKSLDDGLTWVLMANYENLVVAPGSSYTPTFSAGQSGPGIQSWYDLFIAVDPTDEGRVLLGLEEVFESVGGSGVSLPTWKVVGRYSNNCLIDCPIFNGTTVHPDQHAIDMIELPDGKVRAYLGNDGGPYRQDVGAVPDDFTSEEWVSLSDPSLSTTQPHEAVMASDGRIYLGMQDNGSAVIMPDGTGRGFEFLGGDGFHAAVDPKDPDIAYVETQNGDIRRTSTGGKGSAPSSIRPTGSSRAQFNTPFELDPTDGDHLVYGVGQLWETTEASSVSTGSWTNVFDLGAPNSVNALEVFGPAVYAAFCGECNALPLLGKGGVLDPSIFTGGIATNVQKGCTPAKASKECWHVATAKGLPKRYVGGLGIDPADTDTIYVAMSSYRRRFAYPVDARGDGIVFKSTDGGESFTDISGDLPKTFGGDVIVAGDRLVVATDTGVFATPKASPGEWVPFGKGLPAVPGYSMQLNPQGSTLVLATHGRGVWTLDLNRVAPPAGNPPPVAKPPVARPPATGPGTLPTTGLPAVVLLAPLVLGAGLVLRRRLR